MARVADKEKFEDGVKQSANELFYAKNPGKLMQRGPKQNKMITGASEGGGKRKENHKA